MINHKKNVNLCNVSTQKPYRFAMQYSTVQYEFKPDVFCIEEQQKCVFPLLHNLFLFTKLHVGMLDTSNILTILSHNMFSFMARF